MLDPAPAVIVRFARAALVMPLSTVNTVERFAPFTVTRFASDAPLPVIGPVTLVLEGRKRVPAALN